jgi:2-keto-4-pentenoate hydratase
VEEAYKIQLVNMERELKEGRKIVGKKIGLTSRGMQKMLGISEPDYGFLFDDMVEDGDSPIRLSGLIQPKVEAEIAFILGDDLAGPGITVSRVLQATDGVMPAFEIVDSRIANWKIKLPDTVADNASSAMLVLGSVMTPAYGLDLRTVGMVFERNGKILNTGAGAEVLGHPAAAVAWLANKLAEYGQSLAAGEIILSGALTGASEIAPNDAFCASFSGLGAVKALFV